MGNTVRKFQHEEAITTIKEKLDVTTLNNFLVTTPEKAISAINYWKNKMQNATDAQKVELSVKIAKAEALMDAMIDLSLDVYNVDAQQWLDNNGFTPNNDVKDVILEVAAKADEANEETEGEGKILSIFDGSEEVKTPKLSDLADAAKQLLRKGNFDSAQLMASQYLSVGNYVPKKEKQKPEKWSEVKIASWLKDINANLLEESRKIKPETSIEPKAEETKENNVVATGLTTTEIEHDRLLCKIIPTALAGHQDSESRRKNLESYLTRGNSLELETATLNLVAKRIYDARNGNKLPEDELAKLYADIEAFCKIFFKRRGYTEESVKAWREAATKELHLDHMKYLEPKDGIALFPEKKEDKKTLIATRIQNGGIIDDVKSDPEILSLVNTQIHREKAAPLNFEDQKALLSWIETFFDEVKSTLNIKVATDEELIAAIPEIKEEDKLAIEKQEPLYIKEPDQYANLDDFLLLIETAAKNDVSVEDFLKEHQPLVMTSDKGVKKLVSSTKGSSVKCSTEKDLVEWVEGVYERYSKSEESIPETKEDTDTELVSSFKELIPKGKELLSKGTAYGKFMEWLNKNLLNRRMKEQKPGKVEKSDNTYTTEDINSIIAEESKSEGMTFIILARMMHDLYVSNNIITDDKVLAIKDIIPLVEEIVRTSNPEMYEKRIVMHNRKQEEEKVETVEAESQIFEKVDLKEFDKDLYKTIEKFSTLDEVYNMAIELNGAGKFNEALSMCLETCPKVEDSKNWTSEQITDWFNKNILNAEEAENVETKTENVKEESKVVNLSKEFEQVSNCSNKQFFKKSIAAIMKEKGDSEEVRKNLFESIKNGKGSYTRKISKMPDGEIHSMFNSIKKKIE